MNNIRIRRLINEYLDGEIGLADKAQLEDIMANNPRIRDEYERLRRLGSLLGLMPEVRVHPAKFRARVRAALDSREQRGYFTPQRAFATAMLIVMVVFTVTFGLYAYQHQIINNSFFVTTPAADGQNAQLATPAQVDYYVLDTGVSAEQYFSRLALEDQVGMLDGGVLACVMSQTRIYEGATCPNAPSLAPLKFARPLPHSVSLTVSPTQLTLLAGVAEELSGRSAGVRSPGDEGQLSKTQFAQQAAGLGILKVQLKFSASAVGNRHPAGT